MRVAVAFRSVDSGDVFLGSQGPLVPLPLILESCVMDSEGRSVNSGELRDETMGLFIGPLTGALAHVVIPKMSWPCRAADKIA